MVVVQSTKNAHVSVLARTTVQLIKRGALAASASTRLKRQRLILPVQLPGVWRSDINKPRGERFGRHAHLIPRSPILERSFSVASTLEAQNLALEVNTLPGCTFLVIRNLSTLCTEPHTWR